jgi:hypothetical protein
VGKFNPSPSVDARMESFNDSIEKMLWPEKRERDTEQPGGQRGMNEFQLRLESAETEGKATLKVPGVIDRTDQESFLRVKSGYFPKQLRSWYEPLQNWFPWIFGDGGIEVGPIPPGTPINLIANLSLISESGDTNDTLQQAKNVFNLLITLKRDLKAAYGRSPEEGLKVFENLREPLLKLNKCPDFVVNRGHYFGTKYLNDKDEPELSDYEKRALIEFLKMF